MEWSLGSSVGWFGGRARRFAADLAKALIEAAILAKRDALREPRYDPDLRPERGRRSALELRPLRRPGDDPLPCLPGPQHAIRWRVRRRRDALRSDTGLGRRCQADDPPLDPVRH